MAWTTRANTVRSPSTLLADTRAEPWLITAAALDPTDAALCDLARLRRRLGADPERLLHGRSGCDDARLTDPVDVWGSLWAVGLGRTGDVTAEAGAAGVLHVGAAWRERLWLDLTARSIGWHNVDTTWTDQHEGWLRFGGGLRGAGATALLGGLFPGDRTTRPTFVLGGTAWFTAWATVAIEATWARHSDGDGTSIAADVALPITDAVTVRSGLQRSKLTLTDSLDVGWSGRAGLAVTRGPWSFDLTGRFGEEHRPVRLNDPSSWNLIGAIGPSADLGLRVAPHVDLSARYGLALLGDLHAPTGTAHYGGLGLTLTDDNSR